jgi:hypothetical protein
LKITDPSVKPKHLSAINSVLVVWMKDEKEIKNIECWKDTEKFDLQAVKVL